jgi:hypothetical protein
VLVVVLIIADLDGIDSSRGSIRAIAQDERNNRLYITDNGEPELLGPLCYILLVT